MISISQLVVTAVNPSTDFFENQGPSFYLADYTRPRLAVTASSTSNIIKYEYYGTLFGNTSINPYTTDSAVYVGPVVQSTGSNLSVTVKVTNADNEVATTSVSGLNVLEYTIPVIGNIDYVFGDWVQSPSGYSWNDNPYGNSIKVTAQISICLDGSNGDQPALNPPNTCITQFLINDWVIVSANNYQSGVPEIVAVLSDVVSGQDMILSVRVKDSVSGWVRKNIDILGSSGIVVDDELSSISTNPVQNKVITAALGSTGQAADTVLDINSTNPVQNKVITAAFNSTNSDVDSLRNSLNGLGSLAHANTVSATYAPSGVVGYYNTATETIEAPIFSGIADTISLSGSIDNGNVSISTASGTPNYAPSGTVTANFSGSAGTVTVKGTPTGTISTSTSGTSNYTPAGSVSANFSGTAGSVSVTGTPSGTVKVFADSAEKVYTPAGSISTPTFSGNSSTITVSGVPTGNISTPSFTGDSATITVSGTPIGNVSKPTFTGDNAAVSVTGTPSGNVSVTTDTNTVKVVNSAGTLPTLQATYNLATEDLAFSWNAGALTTTTNKTFVTAINTAIFNGDALTSSGYFTPTGNVSKPSFTGTAFNSTGSYTPTGNVSRPSFTGSSFSSTGTFTPSGTVSQPNFTGTSVNLTANFSGNSLTSSGTFTPVGTIVNTNFSGTGVNIKFTGTEFNSTGSFTPTGSVTNVTFSGTGVNLVGAVVGGNISANVSYTPRGTISNLTFSGNTATITSSAD